MDLSLDRRLERFNKWCQLGTYLDSRRREITVDGNATIQNTLDDFIENIQRFGGSMRRLGDIQGTFGFPYRVLLRDQCWFMKVLVFELYHREWRGRTIDRKRYDAMNQEEREEFHANLYLQREDSIQTEHRVCALLTDLVKRNLNPHISLCYGAYDLFNIRHQRMLNGLIQKYRRDEPEEYADIGKVLMVEWANGGDLTDFIRHNWRSWERRDWRILLFQIFASLAMTHEHYPDFRHNDLSTNNFLILKSERFQEWNPKEDSDSDSGSSSKSSSSSEQPAAPRVRVNNVSNEEYYKYTIFGRTYYVPVSNYLVMLWDFDYATIRSQEIRNEKIETRHTRKFGVVDDENPSYDCHMVLNWIITWVTKLHEYDLSFMEKHITPEIRAARDVLYSIVPENYRGDKNLLLKYSRFRNGRRVVQHFIPKNLLELHDIFEEFRHRPKGSDVRIVERFGVQRE